MVCDLVNRRGIAIDRSIEHDHVERCLGPRPGSTPSARALARLRRSATERDARRSVAAAQRRCWTSTHPVGCGDSVAPLLIVQGESGPRGRHGPRTEDATPGASNVLAGVVCDPHAIMSAIARSSQLRSLQETALA